MIKAVVEGEQDRGAPLPKEVVKVVDEAIDAMLSTGNVGAFGIGCDLVKDLKRGQFRDALKKVAANHGAPADRREPALVALAAIDAPGAVALGATILVDATEQPAIRE